MNKVDFLKLAMQSRSYIRLDWCIRVMSEFSDPAGKPAPTDLYTPVKEPWGLSFVAQNDTKVRIDDHKSGPLFFPNDPITVDETWLPNIKGTFQTTFGILIANAMLLVESFGSRLDYINGEVSISKIENIIAPLLYDDVEAGEEEDPKKIYVRHYLALGKGIEFINTFMELFTVAMTRKTILPPDGIDEFKEALNKEYLGRLSDPVVLSEYEEKLKAFDAAYLKGDPSFGKFTSGKILNDSRKKLFLSMGAEGGFRTDGSVVGITNSLMDGHPTDPVQYTAVVNGFRSGSYSRGAQTVEGGVAAKKMLSAANNYVIQEGDCGSTLGITRTYNKDLVKGLLGRFLISGKSMVKIELNSDVSQYTGQTLTVRSPQYCKLNGENICAACAGESMARYKTGIALPLTEISGAILASRMKAMHTNALKVVDFKLETVFT